LLISCQHKRILLDLSNTVFALPDFPAFCAFFALALIGEFVRFLRAASVAPAYGDSRMALVLKNGVWHWRKMVDGVMFKRSTKTSDKKLAEQMAKKWEHEAVQTVVYDGERPVTIHQAIDDFLAERKNMGGYQLQRAGLMVAHMCRNRCRTFGSPLLIVMGLIRYLWCKR
jgi:hypothetical protein